MDNSQIIHIPAPAITCVLVQDGRVFVEYRLDDGVEVAEFFEFELLAEALGLEQAQRVAADAGWEVAK